jgi:hypothetical protein
MRARRKLRGAAHSADSRKPAVNGTPSLTRQLQPPANTIFAMPLCPPSASAKASADRRSLRRRWSRLRRAGARAPARHAVAKGARKRQADRRQVRLKPDTTYCVLPRSRFQASGGTRSETIGTDRMRLASYRDGSAATASPCPAVSALVRPRMARIDPSAFSTVAPRPPLRRTAALTVARASAPPTHGADLYSLRVVFFPT